MIASENCMKVLGCGAAASPFLSYLLFFSGRPGQRGPGGGTKIPSRTNSDFKEDVFSMVFIIQQFRVVSITFQDILTHFKNISNFYYLKHSVNFTRARSIPVSR